MTMFYDLETGAFQSGRHTFSDAASKIASLPAWHGWTDEDCDPATQMMDVSGPAHVIAARPVLAPDTAAAPYLLDLPSVTGPTMITETSLDVTISAPAGETVELPAGTYRIEPPFPWRTQTIVVAA